MSSRNEITDLVMEEIEKYGLKGTLEERGKHIAVVYAIPNGERRTIFCSRTPSDWRASMKARQVLRSYMREDNIPLKPESPLSFAKAMSLPKQPPITPAQRDEILHKDVSLISELVFELQEQNAALLERVNTMLEKMNSIQVVSTVMSNVSFAGQPQAAVEQPIVREFKKTGRRAWAEDDVFKAITYEWTKVSEIRKNLNMGYSTVYKGLNGLLKRGLVEQGPRCTWRKKPNDNVVVLGSGDQVAS